jgi:hypothetical protein
MELNLEPFKHCLNAYFKRTCKYGENIFHISLLSDTTNLSAQIPASKIPIQLSNLTLESKSYIYTSLSYGNSVQTDQAY